ncbi:MAG TPA: EAL domain-containing protein [Kineosporiaceae bacterium]|nr:EAL domain-containing protein [Kineosporiaceae bacterium]
MTTGPVAAGRTDGLRRSVAAGLGRVPDWRTLLFSAGLVVLAALLLPPALAVHPGTPPALLSWWQLAPVFGATAVFVFHVEVDSEAQTFSLSEIPLVLGLLFSRPGDLVVARLMGEAVILLTVRRQAWPKLLFNVGVFAAESCWALTVFHLLAGAPDPLAPRTWVASGVAACTATLLESLAVWLVIRLHAGAGAPASVIDGLGLAAVSATCNSGLAVVAAVLVRLRPAALVPLLVLAGIALGGYRVHARLARRYAGLEMLYQFARITGGHSGPEETLRLVLAEAGRLLRARHSAIVLCRPGDPRPWLAVTTQDGSGPGPATGPPPALAAGEELPAVVREQVLLGRELLLIPRGSRRAEHRQVLQALAAQDCLAAPLLSRGEVSGVLLVCDRLGEVSTFDADDARLFATLASQAAIALENGRLIERLREQVAAREHEALHDALTGLPNRTLFSRRLNELVSETDREQVGVLLMDLDGFKEVNDTLGHHTGDELLIEVARRLRHAVGDHGTVARLGGDEFALLLPALTGVEEGLGVATRLTETLRQPIELASLSLEVGASIGVALWPDHGDDAVSLLQRADVAMYAAKRSRTGVSLYDPQTDWNSELRLRLAGELRAALLGHQIDVYYQPIARAVDGQVVGAEALARWNHPELGRITPDDFVPIAERTGLIHDLTRYVLDHALRQARTWRAGGLELDVAVNLSTHVLRDADWPLKVAELLHEHGASPQWLTFEITESGLMSDPQRMTTMLHDLARSGITFAIDDFGTGYSSLAYLQQLPVSKIKIDKSFVMPMVGDPAAAAIVRSVTDLARSLGLTVVAEGVEDQRTLDHLIDIECHLVQGYYLSRPIPAVELTEWITRRETARRARAGLRVVRAGSAPRLS